MVEGQETQVLIVVGVDGSQTSIRAGAYAIGMARRLNAKLVFVYVHVLSGMLAVVPSAAQMAQVTQQQIVEDLRQQAERSDAFTGLDYEFVERTGNPFREIVSIADERRAAAVIVGASVRTEHRLVGSLAVHLVRQARWPVTVVP